MSFWKNMSAAVRGKKNEKEEAANQIATAPADLDNLKIGAYVTFAFLPLQENISGQTLEITATRSFTLLDGETIRYAELDDGAFYLRKEGRKIEILQEFENTDIFTESVDDAFFDVLQLDDNEWEIQGGVSVVVDNETEFEMLEDQAWANAGTYRIVKDVMAAKLNGKKVRYIRSKASDGKSFISVYYVDGGETFISASCLVEKDDVEING